MGQQVSRDIRSRLEHRNLEDLLIDDKYIEELEQHLPRLPKRSHSNLAKVLASCENIQSNDRNSGSQPNPQPEGLKSSVKDRKSPPNILGSLWSVQSQHINVPRSVAKILKQDHRNLLRQSSKNGVDLQSPSDYYEYTCNVETDRVLSRILWRFLTTSYHDIISELDGKKYITKTESGGVAFVVAVICQPGGYDPDTVREKVVGWAKIGRRYRGFMDALCPGCLFLLPEKTSDLVWERYVPVKGDTFTRVIQFLRDLNIEYKCEEEGWNDLSEQTLQTLREPFRNLTAFQFQPGQQSQVTCAWKPPIAPAFGDDDVHRSDRSSLSRDRVGETQGNGGDKSPSGRTPDSRALSKLNTNRVIKEKRKQGNPSVKLRLQSFARDLTASDTFRPERRNFGRIGALLNHDSNSSAIRAIQFEKRILQRIVLERPDDILGGIWFGCPGGLPPSITLRLSNALGNIILASGREVYIERPSPNDSGIVTGIFLIAIGCLKQMIQRDGFGQPFWNQCGEEFFVTMQVLDTGLVADFIESAVSD